MWPTVMDPRSHAPAPDRDTSPRGAGVPPVSRPAIRPDKGNGPSLTALASALVGVVLATIPLIVGGMSRGMALGVVGMGLALGASAVVLGAIGRGRARSRAIGTAGLVVGIVSLAWTIGGVACTIW